MSSALRHIIKGVVNQWEICVGLEVHAQVLSKSKLFSSASTQWNLAPNHAVSVIDAALPGTLPKVNSHCVDQAVRFMQCIRINYVLSIWAFLSPVLKSQNRTLPFVWPDINV